MIKFFAQMVLSRLRADAARRGVDRLTDEEIDAEVAAARRQRAAPAEAQSITPGSIARPGGSSSTPTC